MNDSGSLKIVQATKHIDSLNELFRKQRPFSYILETNTNTRERATFAKQDKAIIDRTALICGDAIHNLRTALDHAYWKIVSPVARNDAERKTIQFPFRETEARLKKAVEEGLPQRVSPAFCKVLLDLKPHGEAGGNKFLYFLYAVDILDKHKLLIPAANYTDLSSKMMRQQIPDWAPILGDIGIGGGFHRDAVWSYNQIPQELGAVFPPSLHIFQRELKVPVEIVFAVGELGPAPPMIPTLNKIVDVARTTIDQIRTA